MTFNIFEALSPETATPCAICGERLGEAMNVTCIRAHGMMYFVHGVCADRERERLEAAQQAQPETPDADVEREG